MKHALHGREERRQLELVEVEAAATGVLSPVEADHEDAAPPLRHDCARVQ